MFKTQCKVCKKVVETQSLYCSLACALDAYQCSEDKTEIQPITTPVLRRVKARKKVDLA